jgi:hypothetical protein
MRWVTFFTIFLLIVAVVVPTTAQQRSLSVCQYEPPESTFRNLSLQGSFNWYDGPFTDDRDRSLSAGFLADYSWLYDSATFGQQLDARTDLKGVSSGWTIDFAGSGSLQSFFRDDLFMVGAFDIDATSDSALEVNLTAGIGKGRFRDVTPLALSIRVQNVLLDLGELLAPVENETLLDLAQIIGEIGPTKDERLVNIGDRLVETGLLLDDDISIRGLLAIGDAISADTTSLCGGDVQARVGASAMLLPEFSLAATGVLLFHYAIVPDPVSQFEATATARTRIAHPEQLNADAEVSYARHLPEGWTARADYRLQIDHMWSDLSATALSHALSASLMTRVFSEVGLSIVADLRYATGDEELTTSLTVHLEADLF